MSQHKEKWALSESKERSLWAAEADSVERKSNNLKVNLNLNAYEANQQARKQV